MSAHILPGEAITACIASEELDRNESLSRFVSQLNPEQQRRFAEFMHHLVYIGYEEGQKRSSVVIAPTEDTQARVLVAQADYFLRGVCDAASFYRTDSEGER